jgi:hypothetical protein
MFKGAIMAKDLVTRDIPISIVHEKVHSGKLFSISTFDTLSASGTLTLVIITGDKSPHINISVHGGAGWAEFRKNITADSDGTAITAQNYNFLSSNKALTSGMKNPTITDTGDFIKKVPIGTGGLGANAVGGESKNEAEYVFNKNSKYSIVFTADTNDTKVEINSDFYEV